MRTPIKRIATGIDVGTHTTRVVIMMYTPGEAPHIIGTGTSESRGLRHGYIINKMEAMKSITSALGHAEKMAGLKVKNAFLSIGGIGIESILGHGTATISRAGGEVTEIDIRNAETSAEKSLTHLTNKKIIHRTPLRYKLDGKEVMGSPYEMLGAKLEVKMLFVTCIEQHFNDIVRVIEEIGVEVDEVVPSPIAAGIVALSKKQSSVGCALVNIGAETVSIAVFENEVPISLQVFPIGSTDITNDIALGLKIPLEEAEKIKLGGTGGVYSKRKLEDIIEARLYDIFELIEAHLKKIGRNGLLPAGVVLTGGGVGIATIEDLAKATLRLPSSIAHPVTGAMGKNPVKDSSWLVAYGLAIYALQKPKDTTEAGMSEVWETVKSWVKPFLP